MLHNALLLLFFSCCDAYSIFEGLGKQSIECFPLIHDEDCHTPIDKAFTPTTPSLGGNPKQTYFLLFTPKNQGKAEPLHRCGGRLPKNSDFDKDAETILIAHGYLDGLCRTAWQRELKTQLFIRGKYNIILTDWTWGNTLDLAGAAQNSQVAGEQASFVIQNIMEQTGIKGEKFHLIGHSYGSYFVGIAAKFIKDKDETNMIRRVTFLDPAVAPVSVKGAEEGKLSYKNAKFVDVIHSDGGVCVPTNLGLITPVGHIDFYPNGGSVQLSCIEYGISTVLGLDLFYGLLSLIPQFCFHLHAIQYFKVSINSPKKFVGVKCDSYAQFLSGKCDQCCRDNSSDCAIAGMDAEKYFQYKNQPRQVRKYFFETDLVCPYDELDSINKQCKAKSKRSSPLQLH